MRATSYGRQGQRRGVVLIMVLGLLALFATIGISFALISRVESQSAAHFRDSIKSKAAAGAVDIDVTQLVTFAANQLIYDTTRTNSGIRGHSMMRDMYGAPVDITGMAPYGAMVAAADPAPPTLTPAYDWKGAFNGVGIPVPRGTGVTAISNEQIRDAIKWLSPAANDVFGFTVAPGAADYSLNFMHFPTLPGGFRDITAIDPNFQFRHPEQYYDGVDTHYLGADEDYDAPDFNTMFLGLERADGQILIPSFHRPYLIQQLESATGPIEFGNVDHPLPNNHTPGARTPPWRTSAWLDRRGRKVILRPRELDVNTAVVTGAGTNEWKDLVDVDGDGYIGNSPEELDVDTDGDGLKDAIWVDLGYPVQTVNGIQFKPLFAFKVIDLDSKINLNAHGKYIAQDMTPQSGPAEIGHSELTSSNNGFSPSEVNPKHGMLLDPVRPAVAQRLPLPKWRKNNYTDLDTDGPIQYKQLMLGSGPLRGRYNPVAGAIDNDEDRPGQNTVDDNANNGEYTTKADVSTRHPFPGMFDFFGMGRYFEPFLNVPGILSNQRYIHAGYLNYFQFGNNNWNAGQTAASGGLAVANTIATDEAEEIDLYNTNALDDSVFSGSDLERLLRYYDIDSSALSSRLSTLLPNLFGDIAPPGALPAAYDREETYARQRMRRLFGHASWDLIHYNMPPNFTTTNDPTGPASEDAANLTGITWPRRHFGAWPKGATYDATLTNPTEWPDEIKQGFRLDLNRQLRSYTTDVNNADVDRTDLARDIYIVLWWCSRPAAGATRLAQSRTLAQLAVNIVDMRDTDEIMTVLQYDEDLSDGAWTAGTDEAHTVFGFEMPRLVIDEVAAISYAADHSGMTKDTVWLWMELNNPWPGAPYPANNVELLVDAMNSYYRVGFRDGADPWVYEDFQTPLTGSASTTSINPLPGGVGTTNNFLVGPDGITGLPANTEPSDGLLANWQDDETMAGAGSGANDFTSSQFRFVRPASTGNTQFEFGLFRLRNPYLPEDTTTNPWIQIDHALTGDGADGGYRITGAAGSEMPPLDQRFSRVRRQPWQGERRDWDPQTPGLASNEEFAFLGLPAATTAMTTNGFQNTTTPATDANTFGKPTDSADALPYSVSFPFFNRDYASPLELLSVRLYGSHYWAAPNDQWRLRFTDDFEFDPTTRTLRDRRTPWFEDSKTTHPAAVGGLLPLPDLFRFFEFVDCHSRMRGAVTMADATQGPTKAELIAASPARQRRIPGKINLNTITEEEVFRALLDVPEAMPSQRVDGSGVPDLANYSQRIPTYYYHPTLTFADFNWRKNLLYSELFNSQNAAGYFFGYDPGTAPDFTLLRRQWPGIDVDTASVPIATAIPPGRSPFEQVHSELFRMFLLSRAGRDEIYGTGDDKPFRSFASGRLSDTILRQRNYRHLDYVEGEAIGPAPGQGEYMQLGGGGHWVPRLFDPVINPLPDTGERIAMIGSTTPGEYGPLDLTGFPDSNGIDIWMLEHERNKILGKIGNNATTRSNVFAVWVTVGFFAIEPGTDATATPNMATVPCLNKEVGVDTGENIRHRAFFIVDRTRADRYEGPRDGPGALPSLTLDAMNVLTLPGKVTIIE